MTADIVGVHPVLELSRYLFLAGALPFVLLGAVHALATPPGVTEEKGLLYPRSPALRDAMSKDTVLLTRRTNVSPPRVERFPIVDVLRG